VSTPAFRLLETMRWDGPAAGVALLGRHLGRLTAAAAAFGFACDEAAVRAALDAAAAGRPDTPHRVRLLLDAQGAVDVEAAALDPGERMRRAVLHPEPVEAGGPFWRHKTTHRPHYEAPFRRARAAGFDEAVLLDRHGRVVEGTRTTVWVAHGGRLLTPPLAVGCLPGVHRAHLLATHPEAGEAVLTAADLFAADAVYLANAVRGLQPVAVAAAPDLL
jgi:para-aminobenzoate synthetase/4-amino-4-deoxychorismate lyase